MEFIEAPAFTHHLARYLDDEQYRKLQHTLAAAPESGHLIPGTGGSVSCAGRMFGAAKDVAVDCG